VEHSIIQTIINKKIVINIITLDALYLITRFKLILFYFTNNQS